MPRLSWATALLVLTVAVAGGCEGDPIVLRGQVQSLQQQQTALARQNKELQDRLAAGDRNNQEVSSLLAQAKQRNEVLDQQLQGVQDQLRSANSQLADTRDQKKATEAKVQALSASLHRQSPVTIAPNNSLQQTLPAITIPQVHVRRDGDVVRIELPGSEFFDNNSARLRSGSQRLIMDVAAEIVRTYPAQMVGVEGHTDSDPISGGQWRNNHELSIARATAVYDALVSQAQLPPAQLFIVGHGSNHPVVSNATSAGKERNRRVELVIYPDKVER